MDIVSEAVGNFCNTNHCNGRLGDFFSKFMASEYLKVTKINRIATILLHGTYKIH